MQFMMKTAVVGFMVKLNMMSLVKLGLTMFFI